MCDTTDFCLDRNNTRYREYILIFISLSLILAEDGKYKQVATSKKSTIRKWICIHYSIAYIYAILCLIQYHINVE